MAVDRHHAAQRHVRQTRYVGKRVAEVGRGGRLVVWGGFQQVHQILHHDSRLRSHNREVEGRCCSSSSLFDLRGFHFSHVQ